MGTKKSNKFDKLYQEAQERLNNLSKFKNKTIDEETSSIKELINEIRIYQVELELQNDELEKAKSELENARQKYMDLYDHAPVSYMTLDKKGEILNANKTAVNKFKTDKDLLINQNLNSFLRTEDRDKLYLHLKKAFKTGALVSCELQFSFNQDIQVKNRTSDKGHIEFFARMESIIFSRSYCRTIISDISDRKQAEKEKEQLQQQLLQAQKLKSIGNLGGGIAHDYNNKLAVIQGRTEMAMNKIGKNNPAYSQLQEVHKTAKEAAKLTNKILLFSGQQDLFPESLDLNQTIKELRTVLARILDEDINLNIDLKQKLPIVKVDKDQIEQVIINLVTNAQEAMPQGGVVKISTESIVLDESQAKTKPDISPGKHILMKIEDTGTGIKEEYIDRIFDPFFTTKGMAKSDGMGLPSALGIVRRHQGTIEVDSEVGEGTTFRIYLPVKGETESAKEKKEYNQYQIHNTGSGESILVVEDNPTVLDYLVDILSENNYNIYKAKNCEQARTVFENNKSNISLMLSDVIMPDGNGIDLAEDFQQDKEELKIILSSGYSSHKAGRSRIKAMGYKYIEKPYGINELLGIIKNTITN